MRKGLASVSCLPKTKLIHAVSANQFTVTSPAAVTAATGSGHRCGSFQPRVAKKKSTGKHTYGVAPDSITLGKMPNAWKPKAAKAKTMAGTGTSSAAATAAVRATRTALAESKLRSSRTMSATSMPRPAKGAAAGRRAWILGDMLQP
ncbi:hypothetical protein PJL18_03653 [Paenarthrobacter nicotinovorans]|nr:hypothetical protein [Paenarthrobacter nicotinovorans]